ncbi:hydroxyethylthiazole kinase [Pelagibius litoralis]|uniref:Hydroxyethylthiazole kinase n=1 Tax=Pelagibius litoralis TaxID=374515 RepID=A0A967EWQ4_9PROT|nr:hydroxyethylthiazole kinase [Pelagibius litoralis]NIA67818.1 hydroxyethylthiazole kinase [Pelagibius litoralis]
MQIDDVAPYLNAVREQRPLIHCITNDVTQAITANALLALGASPVMARDAAEVEEVVRRAAALVINLGTPTPARIDASVKAAEVARALGIPWVLDPVGVGASALRRDAAAALLTKGPAVIRGNAAEAACLSGQTTTVVPGVDAVGAVPTARDAAVDLAAVRDSVVAVTAARDCIADRTRALEIDNGVVMMTRVTGLGCCTTALVAAFLAVSEDAFGAAVAALTIMGIAGERAAGTARGPGSLEPALLDSLYDIGPADLVREARWHPLSTPAAEGVAL